MPEDNLPFQRGYIKLHTCILEMNHICYYSNVRA
jgi:hypothetical protein